jgi:hypothetical protein
MTFLICVYTGITIVYSLYRVIDYLDCKMSYSGYVRPEVVKQRARQVFLIPLWPVFVTFFLVTGFVTLIKDSI